MHAIMAVNIGPAQQNMFTKVVTPVCGSRKFSQSGSNTDEFFFVCFFLADEGRRKDPNTHTIRGPSSARQRNAMVAQHGMLAW